MRIAICDDNPLFLKEFQKQIEAIHIAEQIVCYSQLAAFFFSVEEGMMYDVVLMDIDWQQGETGMDVAEKLFQLSPQTKIIYVTGYNDRFSQEIFLHKANLSGYLVKPVDTDLLKANLEKAAESLASQKDDVLTVASRGRPITIICRDIIYIESKGHTVQIHTSEELITAYERLDEVEKRLPDVFIRCHKSFVVNMWYIRRFLSTDVLLKNDTVIPISRNRYSKTKNTYFRFAGHTF